MVVPGTELIDEVAEVDGTLDVLRRIFGYDAFRAASTRSSIMSSAGRRPGADADRPGPVNGRSRPPDGHPGKEFISPARCQTGGCRARSSLTTSVLIEQPDDLVSQFPPIRIA